MDCLFLTALMMFLAQGAVGRDAVTARLLAASLVVALVVLLAVLLGA